MKLKRLFAYLIDIVIIAVIANLIFSLPMFEESRVAYLEASDELLEYFQTSGSASIDMELINNLLYKTSYSSRLLTIIEIAITVLYFGVLQFIANGQTLGKLLMKIQIKPIAGNQLNPGLFILRTVILNNIVIKLISAIGFIACEKDLALSINTYTSYAITIIQLVIIGTIIFRDDERGLHDLIGKTQVVSTKKEK